MNLNLVHKILKAADSQPSGFLMVRDRRLAHEVELMAAAGLVETSDTSSGPEIAVINRVTDSGHSFLRAFRDKPPVPGLSRKDAPRPSWN